MPSARPEASNGAGYLEMLGRLGAAERAILRLLAAGDSNRAIAEALDESEARVKSMVRAILVKLDCRNRTEAAVLTAAVLLDRKSTRLNSSNQCASRLPTSAGTKKN